MCQNYFVYRRQDYNGFEFVPVLTECSCYTLPITVAVQEKAKNLMDPALVQIQTQQRESTNREHTNRGGGMRQPRLQTSSAEHQ